MNKILPNLLTFGLSFLMFGIAALQIFLGYALTGKSGHQKRVYMTEEPAKFWVIVGVPIFIGIVAFLIGVFSLSRKLKNN